MKAYTQNSPSYSLKIVTGMRVLLGIVGIALFVMFGLQALARAEDPAMVQGRPLQQTKVPAFDTSQSVEIDTIEVQTIVAPVPLSPPEAVRSTAVGSTGAAPSSMSAAAADASPDAVAGSAQDVHTDRSAVKAAKAQAKAHRTQVKAASKSQIVN